MQIREELLSEAMNQFDTVEQSSSLDAPTGDYDFDLDTDLDDDDDDDDDD